jgi:hypothetical protein
MCRELTDQPVAEPDQVPGVNRHLHAAPEAAAHKADLGDDAVASCDRPLGLDLEVLPRLVGGVPEDLDLLVSDVALLHPGKHAAGAVEALRVEELGNALELPRDERPVGLEQPGDVVHGHRRKLLRLTGADVEPDHRWPRRPPGIITSESKVTSAPEAEIS